MEYCTLYGLPVQYSVLSVLFAIHPSNIRGASGMRNGISLHCKVYSRYIKATESCTCCEDDMDYSVADPLGSRARLQNGTCRIAKGIIRST